MVITKNLKQKYALISVFDKKNLRYLCANLSKYNYKFISTGSTGNKIREMGFKLSIAEAKLLSRHYESQENRGKVDYDTFLEEIGIDTSSHNSYCGVC